MDEMKKYIIEFSEDPHTIRLLKLKNGDKYPVTEFKTVTPYTEPDLEQVRKEAYDKCMDEAEMSAYKLYSPKIDEAYQRGLSDAWDAARKIVSMPDRNFINSDILDLDHGESIFTKYSASKAIEKIRQYEQEKEEQIQVGDEVVSTCGKAVVHEVNEGNVYYIYADGERGYNPVNQVRKTGRHFPEIAEVLQKMKEET